MKICVQLDETWKKVAEGSLYTNCISGSYPFLQNNKSLLKLIFVSANKDLYI